MMVTSGHWLARPSGSRGATPPQAQATGTVVHLLGGFAVTRGGAAVALPASTHRLVAFLALQDGPVDRSYVSSCLWLDKPEDRAQANLRSALWRLRRSGVELVASSPAQVSLAPGVGVDAAALLMLARTLIDESQTLDLDEVDHGSLSVDLLPNWYDDFVELERERLRQMRLHALEALSRRLVRLGRYAGALDAALTAVAADPLRESAHRAVIEVHISEGNPGEAVRQFHHLVRVLKQQLGIPPSKRTHALVAAELGWESNLVVRVDTQRDAAVADANGRQRSRELSMSVRSGTRLRPDGAMRE